MAHEDMEVEGTITSKGGAEALEALTDRHPDIDAIFYSSDVLAVGAIQECHRRGWKVPERIAIAGYGDMELSAELYPRLTTVRVDRQAMGRRAVVHLADRAEPEAAPEADRRRAARLVLIGGAEGGDVSVFEGGRVRSVGLDGLGDEEGAAGRGDRGA